MAIYGCKKDTCRSRHYRPHGLSRSLLFCQLNHATVMFIDLTFSATIIGYDMFIMSITVFEKAPLISNNLNAL